jgi:hypothetical protein
MKINCLPLLLPALALFLLPGCEPAPVVEVEGDEAGECDDGVDNDQDGTRDCDDDGCGADAACARDDDDDDVANDDDVAAACAAAVPCMGDYDIQSSAELDEIGLCESISGNLRFQAVSGLMSIDIRCLRSVGGSLFVFDNDALSAVAGLPSLTSLGDGLYIEGNDALTDLSGLSNLTSVGGTLDIENNDVLPNLRGLSGVGSVGGDVNIRDNIGLADTSDLASLTSVGGLLHIGYNDALADISGMFNACSVDGNLIIRTNPSLCQSSVDAFVAACTVGGSVSTYDNDDGC